MSYYGVLVFLSIVFVAHAHIKYPDEHLPEGNTTVLAITDNGYAIHVFALGKDGGLWHKYQAVNESWTDWILRAKADDGVWDSDPACGVNKGDNTVEVFIRYSRNLDLWQMYQLDARDPTQWSVARESSCVDLPCNNTGSKTFWNTQPIFPTSDISVVSDSSSGQMSLFYRGFDGGLYVVKKKESTAHSYWPPSRFDVIIE